ncbi:hypothetical protein F4801DRAFT_571691 [Xylaria longipes]|nr:hypothetical protein F4801DRAFT_571691 [Xylaria longipes]RYC57597.1 hypothetical protein CHU98_g8610 [Xylaria longipes]
MPPKRKSTGSSGPASKKAKGAAAATPAAEDTYEPPRGERWAAVSGSANLEGNYRMVWKDEEKAYSYITLCSAYYVRDDDEDDEDDDSEASDKDDSDDNEDDDEDEEGGEEDTGDGTKRLGPRCEKKRCVCFKPLSANPEHPWVISWAGFNKFNSQFTLANLRIPDNFDMYTFNDHAGYGSLEVLQNLFLDFEEAAKDKRGGWREQWAVCECVAHWLLQQTGQLFTQIDDGDGVHETMLLVGRMFLAMLAQLDELGLVGDATEVKSLGCTMAMYMALAAEMRGLSALGDGPRNESGTKGKKFQPDYFDDAILSYANKRGVMLRGPSDIEEIVAEAEGDVGLPAKNARDPWGWKAGLKKYTKDRDGKIGGDHYDITTWPSAERKAASFNKKDPLSRKDMDALKKGMVMQMA